MYPLFESVCIENGKIKNAIYHESRFRNSYLQLFKTRPNYSLFDGIILTNVENSIKYKLRIEYNQERTRHTFTEYKNSIPTTLKVVYEDDISYSSKWNDRIVLNDLYTLKGDFEDVLIIKNGMITDASYSNILFTDGQRITTPSTPLLQGTCRAKLLKENIITEVQISEANLQKFKSFQLINALNYFDENRWQPIENIGYSTN